MSIENVVPEATGPETVELRLARALPRRTPLATGPWHRATPREEAPSWFTRFADQPFESASRTVERVRDGLYELG